MATAEFSKFAGILSAALPKHHLLGFVILWTVACQASLTFTISQSLLKFMSIESVMPSNHHILCHPLFLLPSIFPNIRLFHLVGHKCQMFSPQYQTPVRQIQISVASSFLGVSPFENLPRYMFVYLYLHMLYTLVIFFTRKM